MAGSVVDKHCSLKMEPKKNRCCAPAYRHRIASQLWDSNDGFDLFQVFKVCETRCQTIKVDVLRGASISKGILGDFLDTPDPYVVMSVPGTPNGTKRTRTVDNCRNPTWDNTFYFYINPEIQNSLCVSLVDANVLEDSTMGSVMVSLDDIRLNVVTDLMIMYKKGSKVYLKIYKEESEPKDLRLDLSLCKEEKDFLRIRRLRVLNGMKTFLGEDSPKKVQEVPTVAVLGSGGGIRALVGYYGAFKALQDMQLIDCIMFIAALSGSSWFLSFLYSQPDFPEKGPKEFEAELRDILSESLVKCFSPVNVYRTVSAIVNKRIAGQPISLTDFFGHLLGDLLLRKHKDVKLSDQRRVLDYGRAPLPLYTCINVKHNVSARVFQEWVEFNPYEIGVTKYGTYTKPENFGSKFYLGNIIKKFPEPPLHFLQGIWGSAYSIQFKRLIKEICHMDSSAPERKMEDYDLEEEDFRNYIPEHDMTHSCDDDSDDDVESHDSDRSDLEDSDAEYISLAWKSFDARTIIQHTLDFITTEIHFEERDRKLQSQFIKERARTKPRRHNPWKEQKKVQRKGKQSNETTLFDAAISSLLSSAAINSSRVLRAGIIHNVMRGLHLQNVFNVPDVPATSPLDEDDFKGVFEKSETEGKKLFLVDSGLTFNLPFPLLLRSQRAVDLFLCFDFSERHSDDEQPFDEILLAEKWASKIKIPFPPIKKVVDEMSKDEPLKECYVFEDTENPYCPVILFFPLINNKFREFKAPGVKRETKEEKDFGSFDIFSDPEKSFRTFKFRYTNENFDRLSKLVEFNLKDSEPLIRFYMKKAVERKSKLLPKPVLSLKQIVNMRLRPKNKEMMEILQAYMKTIAEDKE